MPSISIVSFLAYVKILSVKCFGESTILRKRFGRVPRRARKMRKCPFTRSHGSKGPAAGGVPVDFAPPAPPSSQAERRACLAPLLNDLDFSPNADAERGKRRFSCQRNFHCLTFRNLVGLRAARRRFPALLRCRLHDGMGAGKRPSAAPPARTPRP